MENQRQFLTIALLAILAVLYFKWVEFSAPKVDPLVQSQAPISNAVPTESPSDVPANVPNLTTQAPESVPQLAEVSEQSVVPLIEVETDLIKAKINPVGGVLESLELKQHLISLDQPEQGFPLLKRTAEEKYLVQDGLLAQAGAPSHQTLYTAVNNSYRLGAQESLVVPLSWTSESGVKITKTFTFTRDSYLINVDYAVENNSTQAWTGFHYGQVSRTLPLKKRSSFGQLPSHTGAALYEPENKYQKFDFDEIADKDFNDTLTDSGWIAMMQHYFVSAWLPAAGRSEFSMDYDRPTDLYWVRYVSKVGASVAAGANGTISSQVFIGPKEQNRLIALQEQGYEGINKTVDYGFLTFIGDPLFWLLDKIHNVVGNWGWSIIILTILIKLAFYPLSAAGYKSMAKMKRVQPRMQTLKERYKDDRQKFQMEMMALYKKEKINPAGGCFPILIQIPVFIALYWVLLESVEIRHAPFALWWQDLSAPDPYYVLPVLMGASMWLMQKLNPAPMDDIQKKVMMIMPIALTFLFLTFPQGLVLYWVVNNVLSMAQQWLINKRHAT